MILRSGSISRRLRLCVNNHESIELAERLLNNLRQDIKILSRLYIRELDASCSPNNPIVQNMRIILGELGCLTKTLSDLYGGL